MRPIVELYLAKAPRSPWSRSTKNWLSRGKTY